MLSTDLWLSVVLTLMSSRTFGHNYIGHNYIGHKYTGHDYIVHNYHNYITDVDELADLRR